MTTIQDAVDQLVAAERAAVASARAVEDAAAHLAGVQKAHAAAVDEATNALAAAQAERAAADEALTPLRGQLLAAVLAAATNTD